MGGLEVDPTKQPGIRIAQIFLESAKFAHRHDYLSIPSTQGALDIAVELGLEFARAADGSSALLRATVTTNESAQPIYIFSISLVGIVERDAAAQNIEPEEYVAQFGHALMFPFVREAVASITGRGRFGPVWLKPVNLTALGEDGSVTAKRESAGQGAP